MNWNQIKEKHLCAGDGVCKVVFKKTKKKKFIKFKIMASYFSVLNLESRIS